MTLLDPLLPALARPWFDAIALPLVTRTYMPLSRAWTAAAGAAGDVDQFARETGLTPTALGLARAVNNVKRLNDRYRDAVAAWDEAFLAPESPSAKDLAKAERSRGRTAARFMSGRRLFLPWFRQLPPVAWDIPSPAEVAESHGPRLAALETAYAALPLTPIAKTHALENERVRTYWIRFRSPVLGDTVTARVTEPTDAIDPPTVIMLHGIAVEMEMWPQYPDPLDTLLDEGIRIVRPEGPWHGRRMIKGCYGGEPIMARAPEGMLTCLQAWSAEVTTMMNWARDQGSARVAVAGVSLGALTSQMIATVCGTWERPLRPDAAFLVTTTGRTLDVVFAGSLARGIGLPERLENAGWDRATLEQWLPLLQPSSPPVMGPENVVMVLGDADDLTPYAGGLELARQWSVPADNLFIRHQGHFSAALGLTPDPAPITRLGTLLRR